MNYMAKAQRSSAVLSHTTSSVLLRDLFDVSLSQFISEAASGCSEDVVSLAVSAATAPSTSFLSGDTSVVDLSQCKNIFLSGVTGFLGCHLLQDLINNSSASIHCLVRASTVSPSDAKSRLDSCLRKYNVNLSSEQFARVIVHNGDLTLPLFGLSESQFLQLSESLDAIVHNGAHVNWIMTYAQLRPANVMASPFFVPTDISCRCELVIFSVSGNLNSVAFGSCWEAQIIRSHIYAQVSIFANLHLFCFFLQYQLFFALLLTVF